MHQASQRSLMPAHYDVRGRPDLTPQEAAECLGLTPRGLRQWRTRNYGPAYYRGLGKQVLYRQSDLDRFIESRRVEPETLA